MSGCNDCALSKKCFNTLTRGRGKCPPKRTEIMIVQDAPTYLDMKVGQCPTGDTQKKLNYFIEQSKLDYRKLYFTSAVKCGPKKLSDIKKKHIEECRKYLIEEILLHKPKVIIAMGRYAHEALTENTSIREFAGHFDDLEIDYDVTISGKTYEKVHKCKIMPTYGLMTSLSMWKYNSDIIRHFKKAVKYQQKGIIDKTPEPKVNTILTLKGLKVFEEKYTKLAENRTPVATDFETTGFEFFNDEIINVGYSYKEGHSDVIFLNGYSKEHTKGWHRNDVKRAKQVNKFLKKHRRRVWKTVKRIHALKLRWVLHNGKFDLKFAAYHKIPYKIFHHDTLLASPLIDENLPHALNMCLERNGFNYGAYDTKNWKWVNKDEKKQKTYKNIPTRQIELYLGIDVEGLIRLYYKQLEQLKKEGMTEHFYNTKMPSLRDVTKNEFIGVKMDKKLIQKASRIIENAQIKLKKKMVDIVGDEDFNPNSDKQVSDFMIEEGYPFKKLQVKENKNGYSVSKEELGKFLKYKKWSEFPQLILNNKKLSKIKGTYVDGKSGDGGMIQYLDKKHRVHANYNMWSPVTGRYSCSRPSLQVWPRPIKGLPNTRNFIIPTNKKWRLFEADYSQLEQCVVAALSMDKILIQKIQNGSDLHCFNATEIGRLLGTVPQWVKYEHMMVANGKEHDLMRELSLDEKDIKAILEQIEKKGVEDNIDWSERRTQAKTIGFGLNYGKGAPSFADEFGIDRSEAEDMIDAYFGIYKGMKRWRDKIVDDALRKGVISLESGRKRRFHAGVDWLNSKFSEGVWSAQRMREEISRQAMNYPVQGGAHEVFEPAVLRLNKRIKKEGLRARLMLLIHDGIIGECPMEERLIVEQLIKEEMAHTFHKGTKYELNLNLDVDHYEWAWYSQKIKDIQKEMKLVS